MKLVVLSMLAAAALATAGCGGGNASEGGSEVAYAGGPGASSLAVSAPVLSGGGVATAAGITVVGTGEADVVPDVADWSFGVRSDAGTASAALSANAEAMRKVIDSLRSAGVAKDDIRTQEVSLYPQTSSDGRTVTGYSASNTVTATIRRLDQAGKAVDAAVRAGANDVYGPNLRPSDTSGAYRVAVDEAFEDARAHAEAIAAKAGVSLGAPVAITEGGGSTPGPVVYDQVGTMAASAGAAEAAPVEPGKQQVSATLTVTFAIATRA